NVVVSAPLPGSPANTVTLPDGTHAPAQSGGDKLVFVLPKLKAGEAVRVTPTTLNYVKAPPQFRFVDEPRKHKDLLFGDRLVTRFVDAKRDGTTKESHFLTFKPFHHVYDPATGKVELTSGALP